MHRFIPSLNLEKLKTIYFSNTRLSGYLLFAAILLYTQLLMSMPVKAALCEDPIRTKGLISTNGGEIDARIGVGCETGTVPSQPAWIQVPSSDTDGTFTVSWAVTKNANYYELEQSSGVASYRLVSSGSALTFNTSSLADGTYTYRVKGCSYTSGCGINRVSSSVVVERPTEPPIPEEGDSSRDLISDAVGAVNGSFRVDEGGQANYSIPIYAPVGIAGVQPSVSLNYNSAGGNGVMGVGWQISANGGIYRCPQSMAIDGKHGSINFDENDRFCFGGQQLVVVSGDYGAANSEYRTAIDSQTKVIAYGSEGSGPQYFKVWQKDGSISAYGITNNSQFHANDDGVITNEILTWAQTYSEDRFGNKINYFYQLDEANGENQIESIEYSPNVKIQFNYTSDRSDVKYGYYLGGKTQRTERLDSVVVTDENIEVRRYDFDYETGRSLQSRLTTVTESKDGISLLPTSFEWSDPIKGIQADTQERNGLKMQQGSFINLDGDLEPDWLYIDADDEVWVDKDTGESTSAFSNAVIGTRFASHDFDGAEYLKTCEGYVEGDIHGGRTSAVFDLDGDGRDEALVSTKNEIIAVFFGEDGCLAPWSERSQKIADIDTDESHWYFGDVDGDAMPDIVYQRSNKTYIRYNIMADSSTSDYFTAEQALSFNITSLTGGGNPWTNPIISTVTVNADHSSYADFNSDGQMDMVVKAIKSTSLSAEYCGDINPYDPQCDSFTPTYTSHWVIVTFKGNNEFEEFISLGDLSDAVTKSHHVKFVDINMDGLPDLVFRNHSDDRWRYKIFTGTKFLNSQTTYVDNDKDIYFGDHDLDGRMEIYNISSNRVYKREFGVNGYLPSNNTDTGMRSQNGWRFAQVDLNADGELDVISVEPDEHFDHTSYDNYASFNKTPFQIQDRIETIDNGMGNLTYIDYHALSDPAKSDLYESHKGWETTGTSGEIQFNVRGPQYVVSKVESSAPSYSNANNLNGVEYRYGKSRSHSVHGSLGFEWLETIDLQTDMITRTTYHQEYPYVGRPLKSQVWYKSRINSRLISEARNEYNTRSVGSYDKWNKDTNSYQAEDILFPYQSRGEEDSYDFNASTLNAGALISRTITTSSYNDYGDPTVQNIYNCYGHAPNCTSSGWMKRVRTTNTYASADLNNWILGRLTRAKANHYGDGVATITRTTDFEYDSLTGILKAEIIEPLSASRQKYLRTEYSHDTFGNTTRKTVCDNVSDCSNVPTSDPYHLYLVYRTTETRYDSDGRYVTKSLNGYGQTVSEVIERNELGQATVVSDITGAESKQTYGTFGQDYFTESAAGNWTKIQSALCSVSTDCPTEAFTRIKSTAADGSESYAYLDALGRTVETRVQGFGNYDLITETEFDNSGNIYQTSLPYKSTESGSIVRTKNSYDTLDRIYRVDYPDGSRDLRYYDGYIASELATKTRIVNDKGQTKTEYKNIAGELTKVTDNNNKSLTYAYNATGDVLTVHFDNVKKTEVEYNSMGRKSKMWDWDKGAQNENRYWQYNYNALGELVYQKDPKGQQVRIYRDRSGRKIRQLDRNSSNVYVADFRWTYNNSTSQSNSIGKLTKQRDNYDTDLVVEYEYDSLGRNDVTTTTIAGKAFVKDVTFDSIGRVFESFDASGADHGLKNIYDSKGFLIEVSETKANDNTVYREILEMDQFGNVTKEVFGNGVITEREYEDTSGRLIRINTTDGIAVRQNLEYEWDSLGRLEERQSITKNLTEIFTYDNLNRIKTVNGVNLYNYDAKGNITWKQDVGSYSYGGSCGSVVAGSHAVSSAGGKSYCYDLNGNMISGDGRTAEYSIFDKATKVIKGGHTTEFAYSPTRSRYKRIDTSSAGVTTTFYLGGTEYIQKPSGETFYRRSLPGAVVDVPASGSMTTKYLHTDHLGSTDVITDHNGNTAQESSFDAFGKKRRVSTWTGDDFEVKFGPLELTSKAYTGHESAEEVGIIHMNGRIYDPKLARFMQADPFIDGVTDSQGFNRYTYVRNNPLAYTDPTGFKRSGGLKRWQKTAKAAMGPLGNSSTGRQLFQVVGTMACGPAAPLCAAAISSWTTFANGGNGKMALEAGARTYASAYISGEIGNSFGELKTPGQIFRASVAHGTLGGVMNVLGGGKFGHGFASAFMSKFILTHLDLKGDIDKKIWGTLASRTFVAAMVGGTISEATGGKFANGAVQSALQWVFNAEADRGNYVKSDTGVFLNVSVFGAGIDWEIGPDGNVLAVGFDVNELVGEVSDLAKDEIEDRILDRLNKRFANGFKKADKITPSFTLDKKGRINTLSIQGVGYSAQTLKDGRLQIKMSYEIFSAGLRNSSWRHNTNEANKVWKKSDSNGGGFMSGYCNDVFNNLGLCGG